MIESKLLGRKPFERPACPFCGLNIEKPKELNTRMPGEMPVGSCSCGAVYAYDATGHSLGTAMVEALVFGCNGDWDLAWDLLPEEDYLEKQVKNYDLETHLILPGGAYEGRRIAGTLFFIRLHQDVREVTEEGARRRLDKATPISQKNSFKKRNRKLFSKKEVETWVNEYKLDAMLSIAERDPRIIRDLQRLLYSAENGLRWRAADILGRVSALIAQKDPGTISKLLQGLFTSVTDTAASSWGSLVAIGEILSHNPEQFAGYLPQLYPLMRDRGLLPDVLRALAKIGQTRPDLIRKKTFYFIPLLQDRDPEIRGYAAILLGNLSAHEAIEDLEALGDDAASFETYRDGHVRTQAVGEMVSKALEKLL
jgi:hypothetical protein